MNFSTAEFCEYSNETGFRYISICYPYYAFQSCLLTILEIGLGIATVFFNILVFKMIYDKKEKKKVFDQILMSHAIVDGVVGSIDLPIYHTYTTLGKWPFGETFCIMWNSLDSSLNTITILHMLYMSWVRLMSVIEPQTYLQNKIIKHPFIVSLLCWSTGFLIWIPVNIVYITSNYTEGQCSIPFKRDYIEFILTLVSWFLPLITIVCIFLYFIKTLKHKNIEPATLQAQSNKAKKIKFKSNVETKLSIILIVYLVQWTPSCLIWMIHSLCNCVPNDVSTMTYWLTFTVALTDPILILFLNSNYR